MQFGHQPCSLGVLECKNTGTEVPQGTVSKAAALPVLCLSPWCKCVTGRSSLCAISGKKGRLSFFMCDGRKGRNLYSSNVLWSKLLPQELHVFLSRVLRIPWTTCSSLLCFSRGFGLDGLKRSLLT